MNKELGCSFHVMVELDLSFLLFCSQFGLPAGAQHSPVQQQLPDRGPWGPEATNPRLHPSQSDGPPVWKQVGDGTF